MSLLLNHPATFSFPPQALTVSHTNIMMDIVTCLKDI
jgi:hypothetical protein